MYILILNLGLKSIRAIIFDLNGKKIVSHSLPVNTYLKDYRVEQDPEEWWEKAKVVIKKVTEEEKIKKNVSYISITSSSSCLVAIDKNGKALMNSLMVSDKRALLEAEHINNLVSFKDLKKDNGFNMNATLMLPKILWIKNNLPEVYIETYKFLSPNDFLFYKLTNKAITDLLNAEKFCYLESEGSYPNELLAELGIDLKLLPEVVPVGKFSSEINLLNNELSLPSKVKIVITSYDAICAYWGSGGGPNIACEVSGTVTSLRVLTKTKKHIPNLFLQNSVFEDYALIGGSNNLGGGLIEWTKQALYSNENYPYEIMEREAMDVPLGANGLLFLPYLLGERSPIWDEFARGVFFGLERAHGRGNMTKAIFESTGFSVKTILELLQKNSVSIDCIKVSGGLTRVRYINQLKSDILNKEIHVCDEFETTALGAFLFVLYYIGEIYSFEEMNKYVTIREIILPKHENVEKYEKIYPLFLKLYGSLKDLFVERNEIYKELYIDVKEKIENM